MFDWLGGLLSAPFQAIQNGITWFLSSILSAMMLMINGVTELLMNFLTPYNELQNVDWDRLFTTAYNWIKTICDNTIVPIAMTLFCLLMLIRLINIAKVSDAGSEQAVVPKLIETLLLFFFGSYLITNSFAIITVGYDLMQSMIRGIVSVSGTSGTIIGAANTMITANDLATAANGNLNNVIVALIGCALLLVASVVSVVISLLLYYSKIIIMYIQAFLSPLGIMMLFADTSRQFGLGFVKWVATNFLAIVLMVFLLHMLPMVSELVINTTGFNAADAGGANVVTVVSSILSATGGVNAVAGVIGLVVVYLLMIYFMISSSKLAASLFNG